LVRIGISTAENGESGMKPAKMITDPAAMELLGDETRRRIIYLLRARELTNSQIAEELRMTPQAIYHHIKKLLAAELVEVTREERVENFIETYYRATAEVFEFSWGTSAKNQAQAEQRLRDALVSLDKVGIKVKVNEDALAQIIKTQAKIADFFDNSELHERVSKLEGIDFLTRQEMASLASMMSLTDKQFQAWLELQKELRTLLKGLTRVSRAESPKDRSR
jgi:DNA-binding transcriptional ArsR family regulator